MPAVATGYSPGAEAAGNDPDAGQPALWLCAVSRVISNNIVDPMPTNVCGKLTETGGGAMKNFLLLMNFLVLPILAQVDNGTIVGTVRDASGAAIPKAAVTITEMQTNNRFE